MPKKKTSTAPVLRAARSSKKKGAEQDKNILNLNRRFKEADVKLKASKIGYPYVNLSKIPISNNALHLTNLKQVQTIQAIPFLLSGNKIKLAAVDPENKKVKNWRAEFEKEKYGVELYLCSQESIESIYPLFESFLAKKEIVEIEKVKEEEASPMAIAQNIFLSEKEVEENNGKELLNIINLAAIKSKASDVHLQPQEEKVAVRLRLDGILKEVFILPKQKYKEIANEIKRQSKLKINVNLPQDGQYTFKVNKRKVSVRVSTLPTKYGESIVLRILDSTKQSISLEKLGLNELNQKKVKEALGRNTGLILATGPTGSGKTTTLYALLKEVNSAEDKIITLEDPIEYEVQNISQSEINEDEGYSFELGLKHLLRQDPDVIMIGEIRDKVSAETAVQAALTGHLVFSTMHANSAIDTIPRLLNMGVKTYILGSALSLVVAQRLIRTLCDCAVDQEWNEQARSEIEEVIQSLETDGFNVDWSLPKSQKKTHGCEACAKTGFKGRKVIAEVLTISEELKDAIVRKAKRKELYEIARKQGFLTMKEEAIRNVIAGETTMEEVWRAIG